MSWEQPEMLMFTFFLFLFYLHIQSVKSQEKMRPRIIQPQTLLLNSSHFSPSYSALDPLILQRGLPNTWSQLLLAFWPLKIVGKNLWFKSCQLTPQDAFSSGPDLVVMQPTPVSEFIMAGDHKKA